MTTEDNIINLLREGIPLSVIRRSFGFTFERLNEIVTSSVRRGLVLEIPPENWPADSPRNDRGPQFQLNFDYNFIATRLKLTRTQAQIIEQLIRRRVCTREQLIAYIGRDCDGKTIDIHISNIRKVTDPFPIPIETVWGIGYSISRPDAASITNYLNARLGETSI